MLKILEKRIIDKEDEYLEKTLNPNYGNGNVFNGWLQMKPGTAAFGNYSTHGLSKPGVTSNAKRSKKLTDKEKEKEKIYSGIIKDESLKR